MGEVGVKREGMYRTARRMGRARKAFYEARIISILLNCKSYLKKKGVESIPCSPPSF